jgi:hypothetical protein
VEGSASIQTVVTEKSDPAALTPIERDEPGLTREIQPTGACWLSVMADGPLVVHRLLRSGERVTVVAREELVLRVGDPPAFAYMLNGMPGRPLGEAGRPVTVAITEKNIYWWAGQMLQDAAQLRQTRRGNGSQAPVRMQTKIPA